MIATATRMRSARALHHLVQIRAAKADVAQEAVVELHEIRVGAVLFRTAEKRREQVHFASSWFGEDRPDGNRWGGLCPRPDEPVMNGVTAGLTES